MKVKDAMHKGVDWVSPDTPITEIAKLMRAHDIGCIPIGEDDELVGMVTDRDIVCKGLAGNGFDASRAKARDVMTEGIHCCHNMWSFTRTPEDRASTASAAPSGRDGSGPIAITPIRRTPPSAVTSNRVSAGRPTR